MADYDLEAENTSATIGGVTFLNSPNAGSGTGNFEPFLATSDEASTSDGVSAGFNTVSDSNSDINNSFGNNELDKQKTHEVRLVDMPVTVIDGVEYYEIRLDLNESNSDELITLEEFQIYLSSDGAISTYSDLINPSNATMIYDLDATEDNTLYLAETSTGSGTDDYTVLIEVSLVQAYFDANPGESIEDYYFYLYTELGRPGDYDEEAGFDEWNLQTAGTINGFKFEDANGNGIYDEGTESGLGGITVYIDSNNNGILDLGQERYTVTDENGNFSFYGVATSDDDIIIREALTQEQIDQGIEATNGFTDQYGAYWVAQITETGEVDEVLIGNFVPNPLMSIDKIVVGVDSTGNGMADAVG
ncbi:hypothetical protein, partial [Shimia biformata]|uniref:hypothetical protein n=1 Tax=Shimia biformata TaxID=1294299 RepID=UPI00194F972F